MLLSDDFFKYVRPAQVPYVKLSFEDVLRAAAGADWRYYHARMLGRRQQWGEKAGDTIKNEDNGAIAEVAMCLFRGVEWSREMIEKIGAIDCPPFNTRGTVFFPKYPRMSLMLHEADFKKELLDVPNALVVLDQRWVDDPRDKSRKVIYAYFPGWMTGREAQSVARVRCPGEGESVKIKTWDVNLEQLRPMSEEPPATSVAA